MRPNITPNDMCVVSPAAYYFGDVKRFDVVVFRAPEEMRRRFNDENLKYMKRVIGLPNETIEIKENRIFVNGVLLVEPFDRITDPKDSKRNFGPMQIPNDEYFILGDNLPNSEDGRYWKPATIHRKDIYSKVVQIKKDFYKAD